MPTTSIQFPLAGENRATSYQSQPPFYSPSAQNVRSRDTLSGRVRGGSRPHLVKAFPTRLGAISGATAGAVALSAEKDVYFNEAEPTVTRNTSILFVQGTASNRVHTLLHFDLVSIPAAATITSASLVLTISSLPSVALPCYARRVTQTAWVEAQADWTEYSTGNNWATAGGDATATDQASFTVATSGSTTTIDLTTLAIDAYTYRSDALHLLLRSQTEPFTGGVTWHSSEAANTAYRPVLTINYTTGSGTAQDSGEIRLLAPCRTLNADGATVYTDEFAGSSLDADWVIDANALSGGTVPTVTGGNAQTATFVGLDRRYAVLTGVTDVSTTARRSASIEIANLPSTSNSYQVGLDYSNVSGTNDGVMVQVENYSSTDSRPAARWTLYVDGTQEATGTVDGNTLEWLKVTINGSNSISVYAGPTGAELVHTCVCEDYTPSGTYARFFMLRNASSTVTVQVDTFRLEYISTTGGNPPNMLMASANGLLYKQTLQDTMTLVTSVVTLATEPLLIAANRLQSLYIADYEVLHTGTGATSATTTFTDTAITDFSTGVAGLTAGDYIRIHDGTGVTVGDYRIQSVSASDDLTMDRTAGATGSDISYSLLRGPKVYNSATNQLTAMTPLTELVPPGCKIVEQWCDSLVWGRDPDNPHRGYKSERGTPTEYTTGGSDPGDAYSWGASTSAGQIPDSIKAIIAHRDDYLIFGCEKSSFVQRGDPLTNSGYIDTISSEVGILDSRAICRTPDGMLICMTTDGLYRMPPSADARMEPLSPVVLPQELKAIDTSLYTVQLEYDVAYRGVHIMVTPNDVGSTSHWFYEMDFNAFHRTTLPSDQEPTSMCAFGLAGETPTVFFGCRDGYIRRFSDAALDDDGTESTSFVDFGPIMLAPGGGVGMLRAIDVRIAEGSDEVFMYVRVGNSAESAFNATPRQLTETTKPLPAGVSRTYRPNLSGQAAIIRLQSTGRWAFEEMIVDREAMGRLRVL